MPEGIEQYLEPGMVKGIGPHFVRELVQAFGAEIFDVIKQTPHCL
jgi:exodeoxyribonuclease V alpha subunit